MGQANLQAENYAAAVTTLDQVIANHPTCDCLGQAWLDKAAALSAQGETAAARQTYRTFARDYAADALAPEALWRSGILSLNEGNRVEAAADLLRLADAFPSSERAAFALYLVGFGAYQAGLYEQSISLYERLQDGYPDYNWSGVTFWLGRAHQAHGDHAKAQAEWQTLVDRAPDLYYGILAAQALQQLPLVAGNFLNAMSTVAGPASTLAGDGGDQVFAEAWLARWLQRDQATLALLPPTVAADLDLRMGALLLELDERGDGLAALGRVYERNKDDPQALYALSLAFEELGAYRLSIISMSRLLEFSPAELVENAPIFLQQKAYPRHFGDLITQEALAYKLNPLLYFSLIRQESLFEEGAQSFAAAQGLAQIIPDTGQWVADRLGHPDYTNEVIYRPHVNLQFGAYYLAWTRDYLANNIISALVGYNAGPGNAQAWRELAGADDALFVELLTVNEPRIYVQTITMNLYHYTRLYGGAYGGE
ncbi:MAG: transglycosylase SLT domain-containing protein [Caldilineaceae bacterium]